MIAASVFGGVRAAHGARERRCGRPGTDDSASVAISDDGRFVAFVSRASNLPTTSTVKPTYSCATAEETGRRHARSVSVASSGAEGDGPSSEPSMSAQ
jgi:hypothetical protein